MSPEKGLFVGEMKRMALICGPLIGLDPPHTKSKVITCGGALLIHETFSCQNHQSSIVAYNASDAKVYSINCREHATRFGRECCDSGRADLEKQRNAK